MELIRSGHDVVIADDLCNSKIEAVHCTEKVVQQEIPFYLIDVFKEREVEAIFQKHQIDGIIHFAGLKAVGESVEKPIEYYQNNLNRTLTLCKMMKKYSKGDISIIGVQAKELVC